MRLGVTRHMKSLMKNKVVFVLFVCISLLVLLYMGVGIYFLCTGLYGTGFLVTGIGLCLIGFLFYHVISDMAGGHVRFVSGRALPKNAVKLAMTFDFHKHMGNQEGNRLGCGTVCIVPSGVIVYNSKNSRVTSFDWNQVECYRKTSEREMRSVILINGISFDLIMSTMSPIRLLSLEQHFDKYVKNKKEC